MAELPHIGEVVTEPAAHRTSAPAAAQASDTSGAALLGADPTRVDPPGVPPSHCHGVAASRRTRADGCAASSDSDGLHIAGPGQPAGLRHSSAPNGVITVYAMPRSCGKQAMHSAWLAKQGIVQGSCGLGKSRNSCIL